MKYESFFQMLLQNVLLSAIRLVIRTLPISTVLAGSISVPPSTREAAFSRHPTFKRNGLFLPRRGPI